MDHLSVIVQFRSFDIPKTEIVTLITKLRERFNEAPQIFPFLESCLRNINKIFS